MFADVLYVSHDLLIKVNIKAAAPLTIHFLNLINLWFSFKLCCTKLWIEKNNQVRLMHLFCLTRLTDFLAISETM